MIPDKTNILLTSDRYYCTVSMIRWCQKFNWQYGLKLKSNMIFDYQVGAITPKDAISMDIDSIEDASFNNTNVKTNIEISYEEGNKELWIIAMDCKIN